MTKDELIAFLKENLTITTDLVDVSDFGDEKQYFKITTTIMLDNEIISDSTAWS